MTMDTISEEYQEETEAVIRLRGIHVHNLQGIDLDLPREKLIVICGVSGSGKTSLALDALFAEGQRRYIEGFSAYARQFLARLPRPQAQLMDGIPPAVAVTRRNHQASKRGTIGTSTEIVEYLRLLYARFGEVYCPKCDRRLYSDTVDSAAKILRTLPPSAKYLLTAKQAVSDAEALQQLAESAKQQGIVRWLVGSEIAHLAETMDLPALWKKSQGKAIHFVLDRLSGESPPERIRSSLESAMNLGSGTVYAFVAESPNLDSVLQGRVCGTQIIDSVPWHQIRFSRKLHCEDCQFDFPLLEPQLLSFSSPIGACPSCEGLGQVPTMDLDLVMPDKNKSLSEGAIAPWNTPHYRQNMERMLVAAGQAEVPVHVPCRQLDASHLAFLRSGDEREFRGLDAFFGDLQRDKSSNVEKSFVEQWCRDGDCPRCDGTRLRPEAHAVKIGSVSITELCSRPMAGALEHLLCHVLGSETINSAMRGIAAQVANRLRSAVDLGLGYLPLDRALKTLSTGEAQRIALAAAIGSSLINMLYVLDEPSVGLHPFDVMKLVRAIQALRDRGNTVIVVEHEEEILQAADHIVEIGPAAGESGGEVMFEGTPKELLEPDASLTGEYLSGRRGSRIPERRRKPENGWVKLRGASGHNLQNIDVAFPLGVLCLVTGVSGSGKTCLVEQTLYPALCRRKRKESPNALPFRDIVGDGQFDDVMLIDQSPIGKSPRSNAVTFTKAFNEIRDVFAESLISRTRNYKASHFSFNVAGGRCPECEGDGSVAVDMHFLADVRMVCSECHGKRYRREILEILYRGKTIADVLDMTVRQAFVFFRGEVKVQARLQSLIDVGLEYIRLGQSANTLSAGEAQRLKLATFLSTKRRGRTLFLMDEPTKGLHFSDIVVLLDCFDALLNVGHSLIIVEHNVQLMMAADFIIDMGPGAGLDGGQILAAGSPEEIAAHGKSATGKVLAEALCRWG
jgi:excinuclease ABC subunit A